MPGSFLDLSHDLYSVPVDYEYRNGFTTDLQPKRIDEIESAEFLRSIGSAPSFVNEVLSQRRPEGISAARIVPEFLSYALLAGTSTGLQLFTSVDRNGSSFSPYLTMAVDAAKRSLPTLVVSGFTLANALVGVALQAGLAGGLSIETIQYESRTQLQLSSSLAHLLLPTVGLSAAYQAIDLLSWWEGQDGLFYPPNAVVVAEPPKTSTLTSISAVSPAIAPHDGNQVVQITPLYLEHDGGVVAALVPESASIASLLDAFEASAAAPSSKPQITRPAIRIFLHELGLTEQDVVGALRSALMGAGSAFRAQVTKRSDAYGMTARMGRLFNNPAAVPATCYARAKDARRRKLPGWQRLTAEQARDRLVRWTAWLTFIRAVDFEKGPLPPVPW